MENEKYKKYEELEGTLLDGRYFLEKLIGIGGMAIVFRAKDTYTNDNTVAIKMLKDEIACDKTMLKRFKNEFRVENDIRHTNIVSMYEFCTSTEKKYMVMLTENGRDIADEFAELVKVNVNNVLSKLNKNEIDTLKSIINKLIF